MITIISILMQFVALSVFNDISMGDFDQLPYTICATVTFLSFLADMTMDSRLEPIKVPLFVGFFFRIALFYYYQLVAPSNAGDQAAFYSTACSLAQGGTSTYGVPFTTLFSYLYRSIGNSKLYGVSILSLFSMLTIIVTFYSLKLISVDIGAAKQAVWLMAISPYNAQLSAQFLRETPIQLLNALAIYCILKWTHQKSGELYFVAAIVLTLVSTSFHSGNVGLLAGYIIIHSMFDRNKKEFSVNALNIFISVLVIVIIYYIIIHNPQTFIARMQYIDSYQDIAVGSVGRGRSSYAQYVGNSSSMYNLIMYTPLRLFYFLFSPLPWLWSSVLDIIGFLLSSTLYIYTVVMTIRTLLIDSERRDLQVILAVCAITVSVVFSWGVTNAGTAMRHREKFISLIGLLVGNALSTNLQSKSVRD